jgi:hypothetical protein
VHVEHLTEAAAPVLDGGGHAVLHHADGIEDAAGRDLQLPGRLVGGGEVEAPTVGVDGGSGAAHRWGPGRRWTRSDMA